MSISLDTSYLSLNNGANGIANINSDKLSQNIENLKSQTSDDELLNACKDFEQYFVEQVMKEFTSSLGELQDGEYMKYFGDTMIQSYAEKVTDSGSLGIAQMLYESMKRN